MVAVVVPIYRYEPLPMEALSLQRCCSLLSDYNLIFVAPKKLDTSWYRQFCSQKQNVSFELFDNKYFSSIEGYSDLMVSSEFYKRFLAYDFILIHQLDAYIFVNTLQHWCELECDYIGAPWIEAPWHDDVCNGIKVTIFRQQSFIRRQFTKLVWALRGLHTSQALRVGNGGFSLRRVKTFYNIALASGGRTSNYNEDLFWSIYVPLTRRDFKIADPAIALGFCFDGNPAQCLSLNNGQLPFAAHAWYRDEDVYKGNFDFWKTYIKVND